jgi:cell division septal protein FtsQ
LQGGEERPVAATRPRAARARVAALPGPRRQAGRAGALAKALPSDRSLLAGILLLAVAAALYAAARETSMFAVREVRIEGATPALSHRIQAVVAPVLGRSLVTLDGDELLAQVEAVPAVRSASFDRAFPHTLVLTVTRERPAAVLRRGAEAWVLSARGRVLGRLARGGHRRLPSIWVPKTVPVEVGDVVGDLDVRRAVLALGPAQTEPLPVRIKTVRARGGELAFVLANGLELRLGENVELLLKLAAARDILPLLAAPAGGGPTYLDLSAPERPVAGTTLKSEVEVEG